MWVSNNPDLALGQAGKGVKVEFSTKGMQGQLSKGKPTAELMYGQRQAEFRISGELDPANIRSVTITPDAQGSQGMTIRARRFLADNGWTAETLPDGSIKYTPPTTAAAPAGAEARAAFGMAEQPPTLPLEGPGAQLGWTPQKGLSLAYREAVSPEQLSLARQMVTAEEIRQVRLRPTGRAEFTDAAHAINRHADTYASFQGRQFSRIFRPILAGGARDAEMASQLLAERHTLRGGIGIRQFLDDVLDRTGERDVAPDTNLLIDARGNLEWNLLTEAAPEAVRLLEQEGLPRGTLIKYTADLRLRDVLSHTGEYREGLDLRPFILGDDINVLSLQRVAPKAARLVRASQEARGMLDSMHAYATALLDNMPPEARKQYGYLESYVPAVQVGEVRALGMGPLETPGGTGRFGMRATYANPWDAVVEGALIGERPPFSTLLSTQLDQVGRELVNLQKMHDVLSIVKRKGIPADNPQAAALMEQGWAEMVGMDGKVVPGAEGILMPEIFRREFVTQVDGPMQAVRFRDVWNYMTDTAYRLEHPGMLWRGAGQLLKGPAMEAQSWMVTGALTQRKFAAVNFWEQPSWNIVAAFGIKRIAAELPRDLLAAVTRIIPGTPEVQFGPIFRGGAVGTQIAVEHAMDNFGVVGAHSPFEGLHLAALKNLDALLLKINPSLASLSPEDLRAKVLQYKREATQNPVMDSGFAGSLRDLVMAQELSPELLGQASKRRLTGQDLRNAAMGAVVGIENVSRLGAWIAAREMGYPVEIATRLVQRGFIPYYREAYPTWVNSLSAINWFIRYPIGRTIQMKSLLLQEPSLLYSAHLAYKQGDEAYKAATARKMGESPEAMGLILDIVRRGNPYLGAEYKPIPWSSLPERMWPVPGDKPQLALSRIRYTPWEFVGDMARSGGPIGFLVEHMTPGLTIAEEALRMNDPEAFRKGLLRSVPPLSFYAGYIDPNFRTQSELEQRKARNIGEAVETLQPGTPAPPIPPTSPIDLRRQEQQQALKGGTLTERMNPVNPWTWGSLKQVTIDLSFASNTELSVLMRLSTNPQMKGMAAEVLDRRLRGTGQRQPRVPDYAR